MLQILDAAVAEDRAAWERLWHEWPDREAGAHPAYLQLFAEANDQVVAATLSHDNGRILYPFLLRRIPGVPAGTHLTDITTAYGYGGPVYWGSGSVTQLARTFWPAFENWAIGEGVISEFVRFSLFSGAESWYPGEIIDRQPNVVVPVNVDDDELWRSFESKVRKNVKRARASGIGVVVDGTGEFLDDFLSIYHATMNRREAALHYYFPREFFEQIHESLVGQFTYFHAYHEGSIVSTELVLVSANSVYSYLGGTHADAFPYRPNDLLKYEIIRWARDHGKQHFVLGGGVTPGDGIERYKRAFAPGATRGFRTGQRIVQPDVYLGLIGSSSPASSTGYFPAYRSGRT